MTNSAILHLEGITKQFEHSSYPAVANVTLTLQQGDLLGLLGPSGCGKTTLLRIVAGFEQPQSGIVELAGRPVAGGGYWVPPEQRDTGMVFQDYALFPHLSVAENVAFGLKKNRDRSKAHGFKEKVKEAIALVGLSGLEQRYPHELSGGQQQRVALARALAPRPALILLDEPLSNLDVQVRLRLRQEVRSILKETGTSAIFVTHDQEEALSISDKVGVMRGGHLEQLGTPEEIYTHPASRFVAEFVTQSNFLPARRREHLWETEVGPFEVTMVDSKFNPTGETQSSVLDVGELMLREENLILKVDDEAKVVIRDRHFLGREYRYCLETPSGKQLHARTTLSTLLPVGTRVQLSVANPLPIFPAASSISQNTPVLL
ncbi:ABC transporter ATP-binding protein [Allocoleopsis franciscana]|uniref:ABC-type quaternary amine transporter n=1 Tax=Allocoleopsis franciscana PCC 7113 TaxID=1173027 RepID=K9WPI7_9CYAN|nr:ABC transporter ATP-binding protein [Allocoleopsis franciscana]AFZ21721.1 ABC-type spermidine/putrescine transport system, ATPase component [Allocoleopsis franciscana PCC 7113]